MLSEIHGLVVSCKPSCCMTAGYKMKLLIEAPAASWVLADALGIRTAGIYLSTNHFIQTD